MLYDNDDDESFKTLHLPYFKKFFLYQAICTHYPVNVEGT